MLMPSVDADFSAAAGGSEMIWRRFAALRRRRPVGASLHVRFQEGEGVKRAALAVKRAALAASDALVRLRLQRLCSYARLRRYGLREDAGA